MLAGDSTEWSIVVQCMRWLLVYHRKIILDDLRGEDERANVSEPVIRVGEHDYCHLDLSHTCILKHNNIGELRMADICTGGG